jgi:hypothetical protein
LVQEGVRIQDQVADFTQARAAGCIPVPAEVCTPAQVVVCMQVHAVACMLVLAEAFMPVRAEAYMRVLEADFTQVPQRRHIVAIFHQFIFSWSTLSDEA